MDDQEPSIWGGLLAILVMCLLLLPVSNWLYEKSAIGNPLCKEMDSQGYYETEWDGVGHKSCAVNLKTGPTACTSLQKFMLPNLNQSECMWYDETNSTCMEERYKTDEDNINNYGVHCVWGSPGYWAFVGAIAIPCALLAPILGWIITVWETYKKRQRKRAAGEAVSRTRGPQAEHTLQQSVASGRSREHSAASKKAKPKSL